MKIEPLLSTEDLRVTVHFDDISARETLSLAKEFRCISKDMGLYLSAPSKYDHLRYTDLYFQVSEQEEWQAVFMEALQSAVDKRGWQLNDSEGDATVISKLEI